MTSESCWCEGRARVVRAPVTSPEGEASVLFCRECRYVFSVVHADGESDGSAPPV